MKNMKVAQKLIVSFIIVIVLAVAVGAVGIFGMLQTSSAVAEMYEIQTVPLPYLANVLEALQRLRVNNREYVIGAFTRDSEKIEAAHATILKYEADFETNLDAYDATIVNEEARKLFDEARAYYEGAYKGILAQCYEDAKQFDSSAVLAVMADATTNTNMMVANFERCMEIKTEAAYDTNVATASRARLLLVIISTVLAVVIAISMFLAFYISGLISKPIIAFTGFMKRAGELGDITITDEDAAAIGAFGKMRDEIGQMISEAVKFIAHVGKISNILGDVADGDLTEELATLSDRDVMGISLQKMLENLNKMFSEIHSASDQVSTGSVQIADGAQLLAQGATEQSATVEELSASIQEVSDQTRRNAAVANEAKELSETIKVNAEQGSAQMGQMMEAVQEINESSKSIGKVIKIIDDIAFQTNILALNAAVEAARAGQHGKGFAVVADEVRSLAAKSAEAAKNTNELIESSIQKAEQGAAISAETSASLNQIVDGIMHTSDLISGIAKSSDEQAVGIGQISEAIGQISQVVQQNSATAEESAAASEEMSGQATLLQQLIAQFKLKHSSAGKNMPAVSTAARLDSGMSLAGAGYIDKY